MINTVDDWLPLEFGEAQKAFSDAEKEVVSGSIKLVNIAAGATESDTWDVVYFSNSEEWVRLFDFFELALAVFQKLGRFPEEVEEEFATE